MDIDEEELKLVKRYGRTLTKLMAVNYELLYNNMENNITFGLGTNVMKNQVQNFLYEMIKGNGVIGRSNEVLDFTAIIEIYKRDLLKSISKLRNIVPLPKVCLNLVDH